MKYIFLAAVLLSKPSVLLAHDSSGHVELAWYQDVSFFTISGGITLMTEVYAVSTLENKLFWKSS